MNKYIILLFFTVSSCSHLFYYPDRKQHHKLEDFKVKYEDVYIQTKDKVKLHGYLIKNIKGERKGVALFFHGNAENVSSHFMQISWLRHFGYDVLIFDYRGYGKNQGEPTQEGTYLDAQAMMNYAYEYKQRENLKKLIFYGQSLGGVILGSSIQDFKHKDSVNLVVFDSTFTSYQNIAFDKLTDSFITFLLSPLAFVLVSDKRASLPDIPKINIPTLVVHAKDDPIVPYKFGKGLFEKLETKKKALWKIRGQYHGGTFYVKNFKYRGKFIALLESAFVD